MGTGLITEPGNPAERGIMKVKVEYSEGDVDELVMTEHVKKFGNAPDGEKWDVSRRGYGSYNAGVTVENIPIPEPKPVQDDEETAQVTE